MSADGLRESTSIFDFQWQARGRSDAAYLDILGPPGRRHRADFSTGIIRTKPSALISSDIGLRVVCVATSDPSAVIIAELEELFPYENTRSHTDNSGR